MGGALGGVGGIAGKFITCGSKLGNAIQTTAKVSGTISDGMDGFDMLSMGLGMIDPNNPITELNSKLHQSDIYNSFQMGVRLYPKICVNLRCSVSSIIHYFRGLHKFWDGVDYMYRVYGISYDVRCIG